MYHSHNVSLALSQEDGYTTAELFQNLSSQQLRCGRISRVKVFFDQQECTDINLQLSPNYRLEDLLIDLTKISYDKNNVSDQVINFTLEPGDVYASNFDTAQSTVLNKDWLIFNYQGAIPVHGQFYIDYQNQDIINSDYLVQDQNGFFQLDCNFSDLISCTYRVEQVFYKADAKSQVHLELITTRVINIEQEFYSPMIDLIKKITSKLQITVNK